MHPTATLPGGDFLGSSPACCLERTEFPWGNRALQANPSWRRRKTASLEYFGVDAAVVADALAAERPLVLPVTRHRHAASSSIVN